MMFWVLGQALSHLSQGADFYSSPPSRGSLGLVPFSPSIAFFRRPTTDLDRPVSSAISRTVRPLSSIAATSDLLTSSISRIVHTGIPFSVSSLASKGIASLPRMPRPFSMWISKRAPSVGT
jgi:hypothetical protein